MVLISWLVNCVVPAKLGDVYRGYLLRINTGVALSKTFGTIFIERIFDLIAIVVLGLAAGFWSFRDEHVRGGPDHLRGGPRGRDRCSWSACSWSATSGAGS